MIGSPLVIAEKARARLQAMLAAGPEAFKDHEIPGAVPLPDPADLVITACEVNSLHGTGTLLQRIFHDSRSIISLRTHNFYDGDQQFGAAQLRLPLAQSARPEISSWLKWSVANTRVRHILCLPYTPAEAHVAIVARELLDVPLCTYIMDDKNVCAEGISDELMRELLAKSRLRLVISPEMRDAYERKYALQFRVMPPVVSEEIIKRQPAPPRAATDSRRGVLLGNIWGQRWLDMLRDIFRDGDVTVDWYCNQWDPPGLTYRRDDLLAGNIRQCAPIGETELPHVLGAYDFAVVPTDTLDGMSPPAVRAIAELSLPSRMVTLMAASNLPMLVIGSPKTCAASFVARFELGVRVDYDRDAVRAGIEALLAPERQAEIRSRAARLGERFTAAGAGDWIWRSLETGDVVDRCYEELMPTRVEASQT